MTLTESQKSEVLGALRTVKTKKVANHLGLTFTAHTNDHSVFRDGSTHSDGLTHEVRIPHWLVDRIHDTHLR